MTIIQTIKNDITAAMKSGDQKRTLVLRTVLGVIQNAETAGKEKVTFDDVQIIAVLQKEKKKRADTAEEYRQHGATERADKELYEVSVIEAYLPKMMSDDELIVLVNDVISEFDNPTMRNMGAVMKRLTEETKGTADSKRMSELVKEKLSANQEV
jgi:uncharacterized protein YqeY